MNNHDDNLKKEFIKYFGVDKWYEEEALTPLIELSMRLCSFLGIEMVPVLIENIPEEARYYPNDDYIALSNKYIHDEMEVKKCLIHEIKHLHQKHCIAHKNETPKFGTADLIPIWEEELKINQRLISVKEMMCLMVEIDAYAFTKYILKKWYNIDYHHYDKNYDYVLEMYCDSYFK